MFPEVAPQSTLQTLPVGCSGRERREDYLPGRPQLGMKIQVFKSKTVGKEHNCKIFVEITGRVFLLPHPWMIAPAEILLCITCAVIAAFLRFQVSMDRAQLQCLGSFQVSCKVPIDFELTGITQCCAAVKAQMLKLHLNAVVARARKMCTQFFVIKTRCHRNLLTPGFNLIGKKKK